MLGKMQGGLDLQAPRRPMPVLACGEHHPCLASPLGHSGFLDTVIVMLQKGRTQKSGCGGQWGGHEASPGHPQPEHGLQCLGNSQTPQDSGGVPSGASGPDSSAPPSPWSAASQCARAECAGCCLAGLHATHLAAPSASSPQVTSGSHREKMKEDSASSSHVPVSDSKSILK